MSIISFSHQVCVWLLSVCVRITSCYPPWLLLLASVFYTVDSWSMSGILVFSSCCVRVGVGLHCSERDCVIEGGRYTKRGRDRCLSAWFCVKRSTQQGGRTRERGEEAGQLFTDTDANFTKVTTAHMHMCVSIPVSLQLYVLVHMHECAISVHPSEVKCKFGAKYKKQHLFLVISS